MPWSADDVATALAQRGWLEHPRLPGRTNHRRAGVCVPLRFGARLEALATLRPPSLRRHADEVSFPGGKPEPDDQGLEHTARRETAEELGLHRLQILGRLSSMPVYTSEFRLEPFVAAIDPDEPIVPDPGEVAEVLTVDLDAVLSSGVIEGVTIDREGARFVMPVFRPGGHVMFGATALSLAELLEVLADVAGIAAPEVEPGDLDWRDLLTRKAAAGRRPR